MMASLSTHLLNFGPSLNIVIKVKHKNNNDNIAAEAAGNPYD